MKKHSAKGDCCSLKVILEKLKCVWVLILSTLVVATQCTAIVEMQQVDSSQTLSKVDNCNTLESGLDARSQKTNSGTGTGQDGSVFAINGAYVGIPVPELQQEHVYIKDPQRVSKIIKQMMDDAHHKLQVVADFDRTLSKYTHLGEVCSTTHGVLEASALMPEDFKTEAQKLTSKFLPIEFDGTKTIAEKIPHMIEWWTKGNALLAQTHLTRELLRTVVRESNAHLRDGCPWLFDQLHQHEIPLLIFSAGLGDVISEVITQQGTMFDNMKIVSNFMEFDEQGIMVGFSGDMIHTFNKNENAIHSSDYFENIKHRENLLLLGDSLGDLRMAEGAEDVECMLKVGFLNFKVEENLEQYMDSFDIVIVQDQTMSVVNSLMSKILGHS